MSKKISEQETQEIVKAYHANPDLSKAALATLLGYGRTTIERALKRSGINYTNALYTNEELWADIKKALDEEPELTREIAAKRFKISPSTFDRMVSYFGYDMRSRYLTRCFAKKKDRVEETDWKKVLYDLENTDATAYDIARKHRLTHAELQKLADKHGISLRERRQELIESGVLKAVERFDVKETLDGKGLSLLAHRLPLNKIAQVFR